MEKIKKFIECIVPVTACNLHCHYCYVIQNDYRHNRIPKFNYTPEHIAKAMNKKRMGGTCLINICGAGETLLAKEVIPITEALLKVGHFVNITTNGTQTTRFKEIEQFDKELLSRLQISFSFHYLELKKLKLLDIYFDNIKRMKNAGCSILVQFNMCDEYIPYLEDIKQLCLKHVKALPHVALTRDQHSKEIKIHSNLSKDDYKKLGDEFNSALWEFTNKNFKIKRKEFCYAGAWSYRLDLTTGDMKRCYFENYSQNIFQNINKPILACPIGTKCKMQYCINSSHFLSLGTIPSLKTPSYSELRNRECDNGETWQTTIMSDFLNSKLYETNSTFDSTIPGKLFLILKTLKFKLLKHQNKKYIQNPCGSRERERERERERVISLTGYYYSKIQKQVA